MANITARRELKNARMYLVPAGTVLATGDGQPELGPAPPPTRLERQGRTVFRANAQNLAGRGWVRRSSDRSTSHSDFWCFLRLPIHLKRIPLGIR